MSREPFGYSTAPDFIIKFGKKEIAVEVTQTGHGFLLLENQDSTDNPPHERVDKIKYESSAGNLLEEVFNNDLKKNGSWIKNGDSIVILYTSPIPVEKRSKLAKKILNVIKNMYLNNQLLAYKDIKNSIKTELTILTGRDDIKGVTLEVFKSNWYKFDENEKYYPIIENFFCSFYSPDPVHDGSLAAQVVHILSNIIRKKHTKCAKLEMSKWLVLINTHPILDYNDYKKFFVQNTDFLNTQDFNKFYLIENGKCLELYP